VRSAGQDQVRGVNTGERCKPPRPEMGTLRAFSKSRIGLAQITREGSAPGASGSACDARSHVDSFQPMTI
jgi:hypothetical protein